MVFQKMKKVVEDFLGSEVIEVVVMVFVYFNDFQCQVIKEVGEIVGFKVSCIINEFIVVVLAYGLDKCDQDVIIVVYDFGGGIFDIFILELGEGVFEVKFINGDMYFGGDDFDCVIIDYLVVFFKEQENIDLWKDFMALQCLKDVVEKVKIEFFFFFEMEINLFYIMVVDGVFKYLVLKLICFKFE